MKKNKAMEHGNGKIADILLIHIEHSKPIEVSDFTKSLTGINGLFSSYAHRTGLFDVKPKLCVNKIQEGCIDVFLQIMATSALPFIENLNSICNFVEMMCRVKSYFMEDKGTEPDISIADCRNIRDTLSIVANDNQGMIDMKSTNLEGGTFNGCTFNFVEGNTLQNIMSTRINEAEKEEKSEAIKNVLLTICQARSEMDGRKGNRGRIDGGRELALLFENSDLQERMLNTENNPLKMAFYVDVTILNANGKPAAYKVTKIHDIIDLPQ